MGALFWAEGLKQHSREDDFLYRFPPCPFFIPCEADGCKARALVQAGHYYYHESSSPSPAAQASGFVAARAACVTHHQRLTMYRNVVIDCDFFVCGKGVHYTIYTSAVRPGLHRRHA